MTQIHFGEIISSEFGEMTFSVPADSILVWKDSLQPQAIFCEKKSEIPFGWISGNDPLKIFGPFEVIKKIIGSFDIPSGSKVIDLASDGLIQMNLLEKSIKYSGTRRKRVVVVDDSSTIRKLLVHLISTFEGWEVVSEVESAEGIQEVLLKHHPDLVTLDLHLGEVNGVEAMKKFLAPKKIPTILVTSQAIKDGSLVMEALSAGALDYLQKPESGKWDAMRDQLLAMMEASLKARWQVVSLKSANLIDSAKYSYDSSKFLIVIGSSTGGTQALQEIFIRLPADIPPILVTQHIPAGFSKALADRLNSLCPFEIKEAEHGDEIRPGRVLIAPGDKHIRISKNGKIVEVVDAPPVNRFRPSVEFMFSSFKDYKKTKLISIMLTGMGKDGALAMLELKKNGALTIAQDEKSSVVFGMPKEAIRIGAVDNIKSLEEIPQFILKLLNDHSGRD